MLRVFYVPSEDIEYVAELKIDGVGIALLYESGLLVRGATRGNGSVGDDITENVKTIRSIPLRLDGDGLPRLVEVRGEAFIGSKEFTRINQQREEEGLPVFANPRNSTAGSLRLLDVKEVARRKLDAIFYSMSYVEAQPLSARARRRKIMRRRFLRRPAAVASLVIVVGFVLAAVFARWVAPHPPGATDFDAILAGPSREHLLGTDELGRDTLSRIIWGARASIQAGFFATVLAMAIAVPIKGRNGDCWYRVELKHKYMEKTK